MGEGYLLGLWKHGSVLEPSNRTFSTALTLRPVYVQFVYSPVQGFVIS